MNSCITVTLCHIIMSNRKAGTCSKTKLLNQVM